MSNSIDGKVFDDITLLGPVSDEFNRMFDKIRQLNAEIVVLKSKIRDFESFDDMLCSASYCKRMVARAKRDVFDRNRDIEQLNRDIVDLRMHEKRKDELIESLKDDIKELIETDKSFESDCEKMAKCIAELCNDIVNMCDKNSLAYDWKKLAEYRDLSMELHLKRSMNNDQRV